MIFCLAETVYNLADRRFRYHARKCYPWVVDLMFSAREETINCKLHWYLKFYNHFIVFVDFETLGTFIECFQPKITKGITLFIIIGNKGIIHCVIKIRTALHIAHAP